MASMITTSSSNQNPFLIQKRGALMLKDYLLDDFSSCSSNGFKSFPRKLQCCSTVRFLLEIDLNTNHNNSSERRFQTSKSTKPAAASSSSFSSSSSSTISAALQKAFINAVKLLPFPSSKFSSSSPSPPKLLRRSFSRKLFKKSFWKKIGRKESVGGSSSSSSRRDGDGEIKRWRLFHEFLEERDNSKQLSIISINQQQSTSSGNSWSESEFTDRSSSSNSEIYCSQNDAVAEEEEEEGNKNIPIKKKVSDGVGETVGQDSSISYTKKEWASEEDKQQFSPVSVLDCPFQDDEEEEISSPFQRRLDRVEGAKQKLVAKIRSFECLAKLEPVNLEKQIDLARLEDGESIESPVQCACPMFTEFKEERAQELLKLVKAKIPSKSLKFKADGILLDFFRERVFENNASNGNVKGSKEFEPELEIVQDWIDGHPQEMFLGWELKENRHVYVKDMERNGKWTNLNEVKEELALELEIEVLTTLLNEALVDLLS